MTGFVADWCEPRGYGFIVGEDDKRYFFHRTQICEPGLEFFDLGQRVSFEPTDTPRGPRALAVVAVVRA
jgi:CspA family cold shock protein